MCVCVCRHASPHLVGDVDSEAADICGGALADEGACDDVAVCEAHCVRQVEDRLLPVRGRGIRAGAKHYTPRTSSLKHNVKVRQQRLCVYVCVCVCVCVCVR